VTTETTESALPDDPAEFATWVASTPDAELARLLDRERKSVLDNVFNRMEDRFDSDAAAGIDAVVHWNIHHPDGGRDSFEGVISQGRFEVSRALTRTPVVDVHVKMLDYIKLVTGNVADVELFTFGKVKVDGDLGLAVKLSGLFRIPQPGSAAPEAM
jgi:hypothetical protein